MPNEATTVHLQATGRDATSNKVADATAALNQSLASLPDGGTLRLEPRDYHFFADVAAERHLCLSNNRSGLKRIGFDLRKRRNLSIDGGGARLVFHGAMLPFAVTQCYGVTIRNLSIDWARPFYSQAEILGGDHTHVDCRLDTGRYPCQLRDGVLVFVGEDWERPLTEGIFEVEPHTGRPAPGSGDNLAGRLTGRAHELGDGVFRLEGAFGKKPKVGNQLILRHTRREFPAILAAESRDLRLEGLRIRHAAGTAMLAQFCENVALRDCEVRPEPGSGRRFSATADASHFVNCRGKVSLQNCRFANQLDDAVNVHGIHYPIDAIRGERALRLRLGHFEQHGVPLGFPGDELCFRDANSLLPLGHGRIHSSERLDDTTFDLILEGTHGLPAEQSAVVENLTWTPAIEIRDCDFRHNRARGILVSSPRATEIVGNRLSPAGAAIKISGDADYWFESGAVRDVRIEGNHFIDGNYGPRPWGRCAIDIDPEIINPWQSNNCFHSNIVITHNTFRSSHAGLLYARSVDGLVFRDNRVENGEPINRGDPMETRLACDACRNLDIADNTIAEDAPKAEWLEINDQPTNRHNVTPQPHLEDPANDAAGPPQ